MCLGCNVLVTPGNSLGNARLLYAAVVRDRAQERFVLKRP